MEILDDRFQFYMVQSGRLGLPEFKRLEKWSFDFEPFTHWEKIKEKGNAMFAELRKQDIPGREQFFLCERLGVGPGLIVAMESPVGEVKIWWLK